MIFHKKFQLATGANVKALCTHNVTMMFINYALHTLTQCRYTSNYYKCHTLFEKAAHAAGSGAVAARTSSHQSVCSIVLWYSEFFFHAYFLHFSLFFVAHTHLVSTFSYSSKFIIIINESHAVKGRETREVEEEEVKEKREVRHNYNVTFPHCRLDIFRTKKKCKVEYSSLMMTGCFFLLLKKICSFFRVRFCLNASTIPNGSVPYTHIHINIH